MVIYVIYRDRQKNGSNFNSTNNIYMKFGGLLSFFSSFGKIFGFEFVQVLSTLDAL